MGATSTDAREGHHRRRVNKMTTHTQTSDTTRNGAMHLDVSKAAILDALGGGLLVVDGEGNIGYRNALATEWLPDGPTLDTAATKLRIIAAFDGWNDEIRRIITGGTDRQFAGALQLPGRASPSLVTIRCSAFRENDAQDASGIVILILEGPEHEALEHQLEVSTRLASLGKLAARVAHELNNPLDGILRYTNLAMRLVDDSEGSKLKSYLTESRTGLMRMVQIIGDLLEFSRTTDGAFDAVNINEIVEQALRSTASAADANGVIVAADFHTQEMPAVCGTRLFQVCCNLLKNAIDAMTNGGRLSITTGIVNDDVIIEVSDTGPGLPDPPQRVFEPFFTTKPAGKGTGLGLAICKDFIEDMNGTIHAANADEGGAVFTIRIPRSRCRSNASLTESPVERDVSTASPSAAKPTSTQENR